ncbi:MAG: redox-sensing transcriptional repressor Rex [Candidatus Latescibacteria bacterium]|nr:redox-sensing transcriptional repressor Rex [Candidatus Latescibacterota bacterium]
MTKISEKTIERLCLYSRILSQMEKEGRISCSSYEIGERADILDTKVRKDLSSFGQFGIAGRGYKIKNLKKKIEEIIGKDSIWKIAVIGVGNLGTALLKYPGFKEECCKIVLAFDSDPQKIGKIIDSVPIYDIESIEREIRKNNLKIGIIATPSEEAQNVVNRLIKSGIKALLNFAPVSLSVPDDIKIIDIDLTARLEALAYYLTHK